MGIFSNLSANQSKVPISQIYLHSKNKLENSTVSKIRKLEKKCVLSEKDRNDLLDISLSQRVAFGISIATLASNIHFYNGGSLFPVQTLGILFQGVSAFNLITNFYKEPYLKTAFTLASIGLTYTPLKPLIQGVFAYNMLSETYHLSQKTLKLRNENNTLTVARNLLVYGTNALHSYYNFYQSLYELLTPNVSIAPQSTFSQSIDPQPIAPQSVSKKNLDECAIPKSPYSIPLKPFTIPPINALLQVIKESKDPNCSSTGTDSYLASIRETLQVPAKKAVEKFEGGFLVIGDKIKRDLQKAITSESPKIAKQLTDFLEFLKKTYHEYEGYSISSEEILLIVKELFLTPVEEILSDKASLQYVKDIYENLSKELVENIIKKIKCKY